MKCLIILALVALAFCGCGTSYHAMEAGTGYTDGVTPIGTYLVTFTGDTHTSFKAVKEYTLQRCAEITVENGALYFEILSDHSDKVVKQESYTDNKTMANIGYTTEAFTGSLEIKLLTIKPTKTAHPFYDAKAVLAMLKK